MEAYRQAAASSSYQRAQARNPDGSAAPGAAGGGSMAASMTLDEACSILSVKKPARGEATTTLAAATERYKDIDVAIAERYTKIGPDFPAMGEHWVNGESVMRSGDGPRPAILTYITVDGKPTLTGVVYTIVLKPGEKTPKLPDISDLLPKSSTSTKTPGLNDLVPEIAEGLSSPTDAESPTAEPTTGGLAGLLGLLGGGS